MEDITGYGVIIGLFFMILYFVFGLKLNTAGHQLGNNSLRQAGNIIMFIFWFFVIAAVLLLLVCFILLFGNDQYNDAINQINYYYE